MRPVSARSRREKARRRKERGAKGLPAGNRILGFGILSVAVLSLAGYFLWPAVRPNGTVVSGAITVELSMGGFSQSRIEARAGEPVTLRLVNRDSRFHTDGGGWHQWAVDELGVNVKVPPLGTEQVTFTPQKAGTFQFFCDVCCGGRQNPDMVGTLVVSA